jgi:hypothetical protein
LADGHLSPDIDLKAMADITIDIPAVILRFFFPSLFHLFIKKVAFVNEVFFLPSFI